MTGTPPCPSAQERFLFDSQGYLVVESFLGADHVARLTEAVERVCARRRAQAQAGRPHTGSTQVDRRGTRAFYLLDDDPLFLELLDWPALMPYVTTLLNPRPHHHASDAIVEYAEDGRGIGWHLDGHDEGYRGLRALGAIPLLQLKVGYYLSDMTAPGRGNLCVVPGSHRSLVEPDPAALRRHDLFPGAVEVCGPPGTMVLFHNALWHTGGPWTTSDPQARRVMLYFAYEHPWMVASQEHWGYSKEFYARLTPAQRRFFHGFVFDPPEARWG